MQFPPERLETPDFVVRGWTEDDGPALWAAIDRSREHLAHMPWARHYGDEARAVDYVRNSRGQYLLNQDFDLAIFDRAETEVLGGTGFHLKGAQFDPARQAEIGMWIRADRAHAGLGSDVLRALISWGFETWGFMRLAWRCDTENRASRRCAQKAGLLPEGTMRGEYAPSNEGRRDTACFGLCYVDFAAQRQA